MSDKHQTQRRLRSKVSPKLAAHRAAKKANTVKAMGRKPRDLPINECGRCGATYTDHPGHPQCGFCKKETPVGCRFCASWPEFCGDTCEAAHETRTALQRQAAEAEFRAFQNALEDD